MPHQLCDAAERQVHEPVHLISPKTALFARALNLDDLSSGGGHHIHIDLGRLILWCIEIQESSTVDDSYGDGGHLPEEGPAVQVSLQQGARQGLTRRHVGTGDGGGPGAPIRLQHIAIEGQGVLGESFEIERRTEATADEPLNLGAPPRGLSTGDLAP